MPSFYHDSSHLTKKHNYSTQYYHIDKLSKICYNRIIMKHSAFSYLFALLFSFLPLETLAGATETIKKISVGGTEYTESGTCQNHACVDFDDTTATLTLDHYNGGAILVEGYNTVNIVNLSSATINTTGEYGIKTDAEKLNIIQNSIYGASDMNIVVDSSTGRANGILATNGSIEINENQQFNFDIHSATLHSTITTDEVTAITTSLDKELNVSAATNFYVTNYTGNYGIYTGKITANDKNIDGISTGLNLFGAIYHKITNGTGDAFYYNDFESDTIPDDPKVNVIPRSQVTFKHGRSADSGEFKFLPIVGGVSANYNAELTSGEDYWSANTRIVDSLYKEEDENILASYDRYDPFPFEIDGGARLVVVDDLADGAYHEVDASESDTIRTGEKYALYIPFCLWDTDWLAFSLVKGHNFALLNREETNNVFRIDSGYAYALAPLSLDGQSINYNPILAAKMALDYDSLASSEEEAEAETTSNSSPTTMLPKAPNTGRGR